MGNWGSQYIQGGSSEPQATPDAPQGGYNPNWGAQYNNVSSPVNRPAESFSWGSASNPVNAQAPSQAPQSSGVLDTIGSWIHNTAVNSPVAKFANDMAAPFSASILDDANQQNQLKDQQTNAAIMAAAKTPSEQKKDRALISNSPGASLIDLNKEVPGINDTNEQVIGNAIGTGAMALGGGGLTGIGGSGLAGLAEASAAPTAMTTLKALLSGGATDGLLGTAAGRIGNAAVQGIVQGGSGAMSNNADLGTVATDAAVGGALSGGFSGGIEGISGIKNLLRNGIGKTPVGQLFGNSSSDVTRGLYNMRDANGNGPTAYLNNLGKAEQESGPISVGDLQQNIKNTLTNSPSNNGFNATLHEVSPEDLSAMKQWISSNDDRNAALAANPNAPLGTSADAQPYYEKYFGQQDVDPYSKLANAVDNARYRFKPGDGPSDQEYRSAFQAAIDNNGSLGVNFSGTGILPNGAAAKQVVGNYQKIMSLNNPTMTELNGVKQDIDASLSEVAQPGTKAYALLTNMKKQIVDKLSENPEYAQSSKDYAGYLAGKGFHQILPSSLTASFEAGGLGLGASLLHNPAVLAAAPLASPIVQGTALRVGGAVNRGLGTVTTPISSVIRNSAGAVPELLRRAGVLP